MKIIDFEVKGNLVRFTLGEDDCDDYWGDDWDDYPYEHNAGEVYDRYIKDYAYVYFPWDCYVLTPADDWHYRMNSPFCKEDFKNRKAPCFVVDTEDNDSDWGDFTYSISALKENTKKFWFEDYIKPGSYFYDPKGRRLINLEIK